MVILMTSPMLYKSNSILLMTVSGSCNWISHRACTVEQVHRVQLAPICILVIVYEYIISLELVLETVVTNVFSHIINPR